MPLPTGTIVAVRNLGNKQGVVVQADRNGRYRVLVDSVTVLCREADLVVRSEGGKKRSVGRAHRAPQAPTSNDPVPAGRVDLHGKGSGRLKEAIHRHLASMPGITTFRLDPRNPGVTWVVF